MIDLLDSNYFNFTGRIIKKDNSAYLGFTNSKVEFYVQGDNKEKTIITATIGTKINGDENNARLKVLIDDILIPEFIIVLDQEKDTYQLPIINDSQVHKITIIKITEAAMSYAQLLDISVEHGNIIPYQYTEDNRLKVEFIGDSITCGYGVYGEPNSEYNISEEDGMVTYAALTAEKLNLNARYFSVSGFGVYLKYDGDLNGVIPKVYPYTNYFVDDTLAFDFSEFIPDLYVINLGTNDSGHLGDESIRTKFVNSYVDFLRLLKEKSPKAKVLCIIGTLCTNVYPSIIEAVKLAENTGLSDLYTMELPYHNVELDGMASGHPSLITHKKDAILLTNKIKEIMNL